MQKEGREKANQKSGIFQKVRSAANNNNIIIYKACG